MKCLCILTVSKLMCDIGYNVDVVFPYARSMDMNNNAPLWRSWAP